jgi:hypothetical protein
MVDGLRIPDIMYADDAKLIAASPAELQALLNVLHLFCTLFDMQVNVSPHKTCIVIYGAALAKKQVQHHKWRLGEQEVPVCDDYVDLGVKCKASCGMSDAHTVLAQGGRRAMHALLSTCKRMHIVQPDLRLRLYNTMVDPVLSYACQVWGPWLYHGKIQSPLQTPAEAVHIDFIRIMAGVGKRVKHELLMHDFQRAPTMWRWVALTVRLWCKLVDPQAADKMAARALRDDIRLMLSGCKDCWTFKLLDTLSEIGVIERSQWQPSTALCPTVMDIIGIPITEQQVKEVLELRWYELLRQHQPPELFWGDAVTHHASSDTIMLKTYLAWVRARDLRRTPPHLKCTRLSFNQLQCICRMRLGWHNLEIQAGRHRKVTRRDRVCRLCRAYGYTDDRVDFWLDNVGDARAGQLGDGQAMEPPEDMLHFLVECRLLEPVRVQARFAPMFKPELIRSPDASTLARYVMNYPDQVLLADALFALQEHRTYCLQALQRGQLDDIELVIPVDAALSRMMAVDNWDDASEEERRRHVWY